MRRRAAKALPRTDEVLDPAIWVTPEERRLRYVHQNGQRAERASGVGGLLRTEFQRRCADGPAWRRQLKAILEEHAGPEFLARIRGMEVRRGVLRLEVAEAAERSALGFEWQQRLLSIMQIHAPAAGISAVRFVMGR